MALDAAPFHDLAVHANAVIFVRLRFIQPDDEQGQEFTMSLQGCNRYSVVGVPSETRGS